MQSNTTTKDDVLAGVPTLQELLDSPVTRKAIEKDKAKKAAYRQRPEVKAKKAAYYQRPEVKAKQAAYRQRHAEEIKAKQAAYYQRHAEEIKAKQAAYYQRHAEEIKAKKAAKRQETSLRGLSIEEKRERMEKKYNA